MSEDINFLIKIWIYLIKKLILQRNLFQPNLNLTYLLWNL